MNNISEWFRNLGAKISSGMRDFMTGRYGHDRLNMVLLGGGLVMCLIGMFVDNQMVDLVLTIGAYALLIYAMVRCMSRDTYRRYQENRKFSLYLDRIKDRENRYFTCPKCHQTVRVPRGKGKIAITCPKCRERFVKKT